MKKQLLTGAFLLASFFAANAQEVILSNDFGTDNATFQEAMAGWNIDNEETDGVAFEFFINDTEAPTVGFTGVSAFSSNWINEGTTEAPEIVQITDYFNFLRSPAVDLTGIENAYLTFKIGIEDGEGSEGAISGFQVLAITEEDFIANNIEEGLITLGAGLVEVNSIQTINVDLADFTGEPMRFFIVNTDLIDTETEEALTNGIATVKVDDIQVINGVLGTKDNVLTSLSVFPNPANDVVNVTVDASINNVSVVDLNGRTVKNVKFAGVSEASVNVSDLSAGVYMMNIASDKGSVTKKIVKN